MKKKKDEIINPLAHLAKHGARALISMCVESKEKNFCIAYIYIYM